jgi:acetylornithine deacetylase
MDLGTGHTMAVNLLRELVAIPSFSREEGKAADHLEAFLLSQGLRPERSVHNVWVRHQVSRDLPTILLNSHIDTVRPVEGWTRDPHSAGSAEAVIYGLGSNDAGGSLVSLLAAFLLLRESGPLPYNLVFAATAEEEVSGLNGVSSVLNELGSIDLGIVGEPTSCDMAVAEKGLMVLDGLCLGSSAHAATGEGINAIYRSLEDIQWFQTYRFEKTSEWLGEVTMQVTQIEAGSQHNVVPDHCRYVVDVRTNECYDNRSVFETIDRKVSGEVQARSFRLNPSFIPESHPVVRRGKEIGLRSYGSMTLSDQALMPFTTLKIGPGDWRRSHTADEYITTAEIHEGIRTYLELLEGLNLNTDES